MHWPPSTLHLRVVPHVIWAVFYLPNTAKLLLRGHPNERPRRLERPLDFVNLNKYVLISTPDERLPLLKGQSSLCKRGGLTLGFPLFN